MKRILYLGGLGEEDQELSAHLRSRHEVGERLRASGVPVIELRASIIIGSGSLSFEMIRALVERLPVMVMPRWVRARAQPLAVTDVLAYLRAALSLEISGSVTLEIGGPDRVSYGELMREYARQRGLRRLMIPVPLLTPRLSSLWLGLVTPLDAVRREGDDLTSWLEYCAEGLQQTLERVWERMGQFSVSAARERVVLRPRQEQLLKLLGKSGGITPAAIWAALKVSKQGAMDLLRPLVKAGLVKRVGTPKHGRYVLK